MPGSSNTSFIPKHTPNKGERKSSPRQLFIGTLLVRILFFATLISAIGLFFYQNKLNKELAQVTDSFVAVTGTFEADQDKVDTVQSLDIRLAQANNRFKNSISLNALLLAIEKSTLSTVQFTDLQLTRKNDESIELEAGLVTDGFDSVIFQRELLAESDELKDVEVNDVSVQYNVSDEEGVESKGDKNITFSASIAINSANIRSVLVTDGMLPPPVTLPIDPVINNDESPTVGVELSNEENI